VIARLRQSVPAYLFLLPWLIGLLGLTIGPMLLSLYYSFTDYALLNTPEWTGLHNYTTLFQDSRYLQSLKVTFIYVGVSVPLEMAFALAVAVLLNRGLKGLAVYRALYYVPSLLGGSVAIALLWQQIFGSDHEPHCEYPRRSFCTSAITSSALLKERFSRRAGSTNDR